MKVTFTDGRVFEVDPEARFTNVEVMAMERVTGWDFPLVGEKFKAGSVLAITAFVWVLAKRQEPTLRFEAVEFEMTELDQADEPVEAVETTADPKEAGVEDEPEPT